MATTTFETVFKIAAKFTGGGEVAEARRTVMDLIPGAVVTGAHKVK